MNILNSLSFEWLIGLRYVRARQRDGVDQRRFISFIALISSVGIALGVAALIVVLSVMNGFQKEVRDRMLSVIAHIEVFDPSEHIVDWHNITKEVSTHPEVVGAAPYVAAQAMLVRNDALRGVVVRGINPLEETRVSDIAKQVHWGHLSDLQKGQFNIVLGRELAGSLGVNIGDKVTMLAPQGQVTPAGVVPRLKQFTVAGIFEAGHFEYDSSLAFIDIDDAQKMFQLTAPTGLRVKIKDMQRAPLVALDLSKRVTENVLIRDWSQQNRNWFAAVQIEKRMMFIILMLIIAVAAFNLVSTLVMTVTDKKSDIAILRTLGASPRSIMKIFMIQGALIGILGTGAGVALGILIAKNVDVIVPVIEHLLGMQFLPKNIYLISTLPSELRWSDVYTIGGVSVVLAFLATLYPSLCAARVQPAQALRYE